ncbi:MAG: pyruvate dehydrogenase complex dihydrolipoamide acetyltransferase [Alphaproteobacteria bacterium]|nr:pyruvate dehydrogenase complex dihydrolipoamide acetyltransferase [Alphaproteobacteria bacterium]
MPIKVLMPALSPTMEKGNLAKWLKKEGDKIKSGDILAEIETDKAMMEVEAVDEGVLAKILVAAGSQDVPVNTEIALIAAKGENVSNISSAPANAPSAPAPVAAAPQTAPTAAQAAKTVAAPVQSHGAKSFASPLAKRIAKETGIDLSKIAGSGPHSRVIERDVKAALAGVSAPRAITAAAPSAAPQLATGMADAVVKQLFEAGSYEEVPHDSMRKTIARRLLESKQTVPHFYVTADIELDALLKAREEINANAPKGADGKPVYKLSVNDFIIKALAIALIRVPEANVTWTENAMLKHKHADVGVAVSIPGGLITPVIRKADLKSLSVISNEMKDLAARARNRKLKPEEYQGGTTAVSNLGMFGVKQFAAIVNPPHATILAVGAGEQRPVVKNGQLTVATVMTVTFSTDHRAVDGALGAELLASLKGLIENPVSMLV